jgi:hypothetical protein
MSAWPDIDAFLQRQHIRIGPPRASQTTGGEHAAGSYHYKGLARDYGNADSDCAAVLRALEPFAHDGTLLELFYAPTDTWLKNGQQLNRAAIGDHDDHVHAAIAADRSFPEMPAQGDEDDGDLVVLLNTGRTS